MDERLRLLQNTQRQSFQTPNFKPPKTPKVLLVDDDRTERRLVRASLKDRCNIFMAGNLSLGASLYKKEKPDIAFIDISLPDGSGHNFLQWVLAINPDAFTVMFSGHSDNNNLMKAITTGAKGFVAKPFDDKKMQFFIKQAMGT